MRLGNLLPLFLTGCATIFSSSQQTVAVRTSPPGATVYVANVKQEGVTPLDVTFDKTGDPIEFRFEKGGYITQHYYLKSGGYWLFTIDWIFLVPGAIDMFFVNRRNYKPPLIHVELREEVGQRKSAND